VIDRTDTAVRDAERTHTGIVTMATDWLDALGHRFSTGAALAVAETRLALSSFLLMLFLTVLAAGALLFAWGYLIYALMQVAISLGYSPVLTAFAFVIVHLGLAWLLWRTVSSLGRNMEFTETRRLFSAVDDDDDDDDGRSGER
jgi:hypothetical protein